MRFLCAFLILAAGTASDVAWAERFHGRIEFKQIVPMGITINSIVTSVAVKQGDQVKKGTTLITLDDTPYQAKKERQLAALQKALIEERQAKRDYLHAQELYNRASLATVEIEDAKLKLEQTNASVAGIRAELRLTSYEISQCHLIAPFDGWVLQVNASVHEASVNYFQAKPLVTIAAANHYVVYADVPLALSKRLSASTPVSIEIDGATYKGQITGKALTAVAQENKTEPHYLVIIEFMAPGQVLLSGEIVEVNL